MSPSGKTPRMHKEEEEEYCGQQWVSVITPNSIEKSADFTFPCYLYELFVIVELLLPSELIF